jgi:hypothetical protein
MGLDCTILFPAGALPAWNAIKGQLARVGELAPLRMIDNMPAFPDETPEDGWRELRVGVATGMVTIRRTGDSFNCIVWGNADASLLAARDRVAWACAAAGNGTIVTPSGEVSSVEFAQLSHISPAEPA